MFSGDLRYVLCFILSSFFLQCLWGSWTHLDGKADWKVSVWKFKIPPWMVDGGGRSSVSSQERRKEWCIGPWARLRSPNAKSIPAAAQGLTCLDLAVVEIFIALYMFSLYMYIICSLYLFITFSIIAWMLTTSFPQGNLFGHNGFPPHPPNPLPPPPADSLFPRVQVKHQVYSILVTTLLTLLSPRILTLKVFTTLNISSKSKPEEFVLTRSFESQEP